METKDLTIILVHGAWSDGSNWRHIIPLLHKEGYKVRSVQNPLTSLEDDIEKTNDLIDAQDGKVLLVGHSYGGAVISGAGNNDKVVGMVYIAAFAPDKGESLGSISAQKIEQPSGRASVYPDSKGFLWIKYDEHHKSFCHDLNEADSLVASLAQKPIHSQCFGGIMGDPAWRNKPTWYQVSSNDHMILPETQREMAERMNPEKIIYLEASHFSLASKPQEVAQLILEAAKSYE